MAGIFEQILSLYGYALPIIAVILLFLFIQLTRKIRNKVCLHHLGGTRTYHNALVGGGIIRFQPYPKAQIQQIQIEASPEIVVKGISTIRMYDVVEGTGKTSNYIKSAVEAHKITIPDKIYRNISLPAIQRDIKFSTAASCLGLFESTINFLQSHLPRTKGDLALLVLYIVLGCLIGFPFGCLTIKLGLI